MNLEQFCAQCKSTEGKDRRWAEAFCETLDGLFDDNNFEDMGKVCSLFYGKGTGLSKAQYYRKRKYVIALYDWLRDCGAVSEEFAKRVVSLKIEDVVSEDELSLYYFRNLDSLLGYIRLVGLTFGMRENDDLLIVKSIAILSWHGVDLDEIVTIRKSDLKVGDKTLPLYGENPRTIQLEDEHFKILTAFAESKTYRSFPARRESSYQPSAYLFRSDKQDRLTSNSLRCTLKRFNFEAKEVGQLLSVIAMKKNGIFCEVLKRSRTSDETVNSIILDICGCDKFVAFGYTRFYSRWEARFYSNEEVNN